MYKERTVIERFFVKLNTLEELQLDMIKQLLCLLALVALFQLYSGCAFRVGPFSQFYYQRLFFNFPDKELNFLERLPSRFELSSIADKSGFSSFFGVALSRDGSVN